jgi:hypothetical protein
MPLIHVFLRSVCNIWKKKAKKEHIQLAEDSAFQYARDTSNDDSVLHRLPPVTIYKVADRLSSEDILPFILSCYRHATLLARSPYSENLTPWDKKEVKVRLYRDEASREPYNTSEFGQLLCSFCLERHERRFFHDEQLIASAHVRKCKGSTGGLRVCKHATFRYSEVKQLANNKLCYSCNSDDHYHDLWQDNLYLGRSPDTYNIRAPDKIDVERTIVRHSNDTSAILTRQSVHDLLRKLEPVCPNLKLDSVRLPQELYEQPTTEDAGPGV